MRYLIIFFVLFVLGCAREKSELFKPKKQETVLKGFKSHAALDIDTSVLSKIVKERKSSLELSVPYNGENILLDLVLADIYDSGFRLASDQSSNIEYNKGLNYNGTIRGDKSSFASISIYENEVVGIISGSVVGTLNLGRQFGSKETTYVLYDQSETEDSMDFICASPDEGVTTKELDSLRLLIKQDVKTKATGCLSIDFEMTLECYTALGSVTAAANWMSSLFNGVRAAYLKEGIDVKIKSIYVHTVEDGYSDDPGQALIQVRTKRTNDPAFTGNFVHLVRIQSSNLSGIAYVATMCVNSYRYGFSAVQLNYASYPSFSWSVMVVTHELGHNMGSQHTQWCGWVGGALDNCYTTEGGCPPGPAPVNGGTIMSYCHMTQYGINFANGFGQQPGDKIRAYYNSAACLSTNCSVISDPCQGNKVPAIAISSLANSYVRTRPITINAVATDDGSVKKVDFYHESILIWTDTSSPYSHTIIAGVYDKYTITAKATDNCGATATSNVLIILTTVSCSDGTMNGKETGIDCGGDCPPCNQGIVSIGKPATQSSNYNAVNSYPARNAFDGRQQPTWGANFSYTGHENMPWLQVDLGENHRVSKVTIVNRLDNNGRYIPRLKRFRIFITPTPATSFDQPGFVYEFNNPSGFNTIEIPVNTTGRYARLWADNTVHSEKWLHISEMSVYGVPDAAPCIPDTLWVRVIDTIICK